MSLATKGAGPSAPGVPYSSKVLSYSPIAYWPLWEAAGGVAECLVNPAQNGAYTGVTLGQPGIGDGRTSPLFDGLTDYVDIFSATLAGVFNGSEISVVIWVKPYTSGVWNDGSNRRPFGLLSDTNNRIYSLNDGAETMEYTTRAGGTWDSVSVSSAAYGALWQMLAITKSKTADAVKAWRYVSGSGGQTGTTQTGLGIYANALSDARIGSLASSTGHLWYGWLAHCMLWDSALAEATLAALATV